MKRINKEKNIELIIRFAWDSLESHLIWTRIHSTEGKKFHRDAIKDYATMIQLASELYK